MALEIEFLNQLYRYKVEAEQNLEKLEQEDHSARTVEDAEWTKIIDEMKINHAQEVVNRYTNLINYYLTIHSN
jgi:hypothetical protein